MSQSLPEPFVATALSLGAAMPPESSLTLSMQNNKSRTAACARFLAGAASVLLLIPAVAPNTFGQTPTTIVMRAMPSKMDRGLPYAPLPPLAQTDVAQVKIDGKVSPVTSLISAAQRVPCSATDGASGLSAVAGWPWRIWRSSGVPQCYAAQRRDRVGMAAAGPGEGGAGVHDGSRRGRKAAYPTDEGTGGKPEEQHWRCLRLP